MNNNSRPQGTIAQSIFYTTPTARNGDGFHASHGKRTDGPGQWTLEPGAKLPPRAFEMHPRERYRYHKVACAASLDSQGLFEVVRAGGEYFDATYGAEKEKFEHEVEQAELEIGRLEKERARLNSGLDDAPPPAVTGRPPAGFPPWFGLKWWALVVLFLLFALSSAAALWNIGTLYLPTTQAHAIALLIATPWVLSAIGAKILTRDLRSRGVVITKVAVAVVGLSGLTLWLIGMMPLAAGLSIGEGASVLIPDRRFAFAGQLLCEFASGFLFLSALLEIMERRSPAPVVAEVDEIHDRLADVNRELQFALSQRAKAKGNLREWEASRAAFIEEGITIFHLRHGNAALVAELQNQRNANQQLLDEFVAKPVDSAPPSAPGKAAAVLLAACLLGLSAHAAPVGLVKEIVIALSPFQAAAQQESRQTLLQNLLLTGCPNGSHVVAVDGWNLTTIFDLQLPAFTFDSPTARAPKVLPALAALRRWSEGNSSNPTNPAGESAAIKVPQFFKLVSALSAQSRRAVVILASPINLVPEEPDFSMSENRYPSDGHLARTGAESIYGLAGHESRLSNTAVYWAYPSEALWASARHKDCLERFWSLYVARQGGVLAGFGADVPQVLRAAINAHPRPVGNYSVNPSDSNIVMHTAKSRVVALSVERLGPTPLSEPQPSVSTNSRSAVSIVSEPERRPAPAAQSSSEKAPAPPEPKLAEKTVAQSVIPIPVPKEIPTPPDGDMGIAIIWQAAPGTDIDLWVAANARLPEAYWRRPRVERVRHFRDIRTPQSVSSNPQWKAAWEYCEVKSARLDEVSVWLNVYDADGPVSGIVRVQFNGKTLDRPFKFSATRGNRGRDSALAARARSPYWQRIHLEGFIPSPSESSSHQ